MPLVWMVASYWARKHVYSVQEDSTLRPRLRMGRVMVDVDCLCWGEGFRCWE